MSVKARVRDAISRNPLMHGWFVAVCARYTMRLFNLQTYLSIGDLRAKYRAAVWRKFMEMAGKLGTEKIVISNNRAVFYYPDGCAFHVSAAKASISGTQFSYGGYEADETRLMGEAVKAGSTVVDVGANFGWHAIHLAKRVGDSGKVLAFEPIPATYAELTENVALNSCKNLKAFSFALGNETSTISMYLPRTDLGAGAASQFLDTGDRVEVSMFRLDDVLEREGVEHVDFIKADIEGGELNFLRGAERLIARCHPIIFVEIVDIHCHRFGSTPQDLIQMLTGHGYRGNYIDEDGSLVAIDAVRPQNGNYLFRST
ncbi:MAG: FkbM family methyltransferase [Sulfuritalea sp.]|nr:FkbM family methyltransferase [Sulfuritalea sp.]